MKAMFLRRQYVEKSKKSGRPMVILEVYKLPELKSDGSGELVGGGVETHFITDPSRFEICRNCNFGDIINIKMVLNERFNRGEPESAELIQASTVDLLELIS